ncbi:MAG: hypothetical protein ACRD8O_09085 [Bryobacteraceae bacterium]
MSKQKFLEVAKRRLAAKPGKFGHAWADLPHTSQMAQPSGCGA